MRLAEESGNKGQPGTYLTLRDCGIMTDGRTDDESCGSGKAGQDGNHVEEGIVAVCFGFFLDNVSDRVTEVRRASVASKRGRLGERAKRAKEG